MEIVNSLSVKEFHKSSNKGDVLTLLSDMLNSEVKVISDSELAEVFNIFMDLENSANTVDLDLFQLKEMVSCIGDTFEALRNEDEYREFKLDSIVYDDSIIIAVSIVSIML